MLNYFMTVCTHISYWRNITRETTLTPAVVVVVTAASAVFGRCEGPQLNFLNFVFAGDVIVNLSVCTLCTGSQDGGRGRIDPATDVTR